MKMIVKMAVLLAALLLLNGVAFAQCECYDVTCKSLDHDFTINHYVELCDDPNNQGHFYGFCGDTVVGGLTIFADRHPIQALAYYTDSAPVPLVVGYLKFHEWIDVFNGVMTCYGERYTVRGLITDWDNCSIYW